MQKINCFLKTTLLTVLLLTLLGCSDDTDSPEQQVRNYIEAGKLAAESRSLSEFKELIADDFRSAQGYDKTMMGRIAAGYFMGHQNIHLFTKINAIHFPQPQQADVQVYIAMTGQAASDINSLFNMRVDLYLFDLKLIKQDGKWLLNNARWKRVRQQDLISQ